MKWLETMKAPIESGELGYKTHDEIAARACASLPFVVSTCNISGALHDLGIKTTKSAAKGMPNIERGLSNKRLSEILAVVCHRLGGVHVDLMPFIERPRGDSQGSLL